MARPHRLLAVLFDAVGTLILLREPVGVTYARIARRFGVRLPPDRLEDAFRRVLAAAPPDVHPGLAPGAVAERERAWWRERVRETFRAADGGARFDDFETCFATLWAHYGSAEAWRPAPGLHAGLAGLAGRGLRLGVLSNFDQRLHPLLGELGLAPWFAHVTLPGDAGAAKPAPAIFAHALTALGVPAAAALYVGDHAVEDVAAARAAGLHALDVASLPDLGALPKAVDRIEQDAA